MPSSSTKPNGLALIANGAIFAVAQIFHPPDADPAALAHPLWSPLHLAVAIAFGIGIIGVQGLGRPEVAGAGRLGKAAMALGLFGAAISALASLVEVVLPSMVAGPQSLTTLLDPAGPLPWVLPIFLLTLVGFLLGYGLLGIALARAGVLPRLAGVALAATTLVHLAAPTPLMKSASGVAFGVALIWLGVALMQWRSMAASLQAA